MKPIPETRNLEQRLYNNIGNFLREQAVAESIFDEQHELTFQICFLWVNRKSHTYDYKISHNFSVVDDVFTKHVAGYLAANQPLGQGLGMAAVLRFIILKGLWNFAVESEMFSDANTSPIDAFQDWHPDWRTDLTQASRVCLEQLPFESEKDRTKSFELFENLDKLVVELTLDHEKVDSPLEFQSRLQQLLLKMPQQALFTGFLFQKIDPCFQDPIEDVFCSLDLSHERPHKSKAIDKIDPPYRQFSIDFEYLSYAVLSSVESVFFGGSKFETSDNPAGETLFRTAIIGVPLTIGGADGLRDFLGAAFVLINYDDKYSSKKIEVETKRCVDFLKRWRPELSRIVNRVTSRELHAKLVESIENANRFTYVDFVETLVNNIHLVSDAYARFIPARKRLHSIPPKQLTEATEISDGYKFIESVASDFRWQMENNVGLYFEKYFRFVGAGGISEKVLYSVLAREDDRDDTVLASRGLLFAENHLPKRKSKPFTNRHRPYGFFRGYFVFPLFWDSDEYPNGVIEFFFPLSNPILKKNRSAKAIELKLYGLVSELLEVGELYRAYREVSRVHSVNERNRIEYEWIGLLTHNIKTGCNINDAANRLEFELPEVTRLCLKNEQPLSKADFQNINSTIDRFDDASRLLRRGLDRLEVIEKIFLTENLSSYVPFTLGMSAVTKLTEGYSQSKNVSVTWPLEIPSDVSIPYGALQILWHLILNAIEASSKTSVRGKGVSVSFECKATSILFKIKNDCLDLELRKPEFRAEQKVLEIIWKNHDSDSPSDIYFNHWGDKAMTCFYTPYSHT